MTVVTEDEGQQREGTRKAGTRNTVQSRGAAGSDVAAVPLAHSSGARSIKEAKMQCHFQGFILPTVRRAQKSKFKDGHRIPTTPQNWKQPEAPKGRVAEIMTQP